MEFKLSRRRKWNEKGQSLVESSFVIVLIIGLMFTLTDLTRTAYNWLVLEYAASEASRFGSLGQIDQGFDTREDSIRNRISQIANGLGITDVNVQFFDEVGGDSAGAASEYY